MRCVALFILCASTASAQGVLLDRVVAAVDGSAITLSDVRAAMGLGVVGTGANTAANAGANAAANAGAELERAIEQMVDRHLLLAEVQRFPPPEPPAELVEAQALLLKTSAGGGLPALLQATGLDEARIREMARENLRIQAYLDQRFGTSVQVTDEEVEQYYRTHPDEFTRNGTLMPFNDALPQARLRASATRRQGTIDQWMRYLRLRSSGQPAAGGRQ